MTYRFLADLTMLVHMAFIVFVLFGAVCAPRWPRVMWIHIPAVVWAIWIQFTGGYCPLTPLENWFRAKGGQSSYEMGFVEHYIGVLIYPGEIPPITHILLGWFVLALNIVIYAWMIKKRLRT